MILRNKNIIFLIYYCILMLVLLSWTNIGFAPATIFRIGFLCAVIAPAIKSEQGLLPAVLICFWATTQNGFAYSYMPTSEYLYAIVMILALAFGQHNTCVFTNEMRVWWVFLIYVTFLNLVTSFELTQLSYVLLIVILFTYFIGKNNIKDAINLMSISFLVLTIVISFYTLTADQNIILQELMIRDRASWVDPNYMGMQIGIGGLIGAINIFKYQKIDLLQKILSPIALAISIPAILITGSRGAALCLVAGVIIVLLSSNVKPIYKFLAVLVIGAFMVLLYNNSYFDLLLNRIQDDDGTGSSRTVIWKNKINAFMNANPLVCLFGYGRYGALTLGTNTVIIGFHNDYLNILCSYGIIGLSIMGSLLYKTVKDVNSMSKIKYEVRACIVYILVAMLTLEPFAAGLIAFWSFLLYVLLNSKYSWEEDE